MSNSLIVHEHTLNDRQQSLFLVCEKSGKPYDWTGKTARFKIYDDNGNAVLAETATGVTKHPTFAFTAVAATDRIVRNDHVVENGDQLVFTTTGTLPAPLALATRYFAIHVTDNFFQVALTRDGTLIDITDTGSGTHTFAIQGSVQYDWLAADVDAAGVFWGWFTSEDSGGLKETFPNDGRKLRLVVTEAD
jgi:hypothetical protein